MNDYLKTVCSTPVNSINVEKANTCHVYMAPLGLCIISYDKSGKVIDENLIPTAILFNDMLYKGGKIEDFIKQNDEKLAHDKERLISLHENSNV